MRIDAESRCPDSPSLRQRYDRSDSKLLLQFPKIAATANADSAIALAARVFRPI